jgi:hypothetical protein
MADCAAPSADCTASTGFSTTCRNSNQHWDPKSGYGPVCCLLGMSVPWGRCLGWRGWGPCRGWGRCAAPCRTPPRTASPAAPPPPPAPSVAAIAPPRTSAWLRINRSDSGRWQSATHLAIRAEKHDRGIQNPEILEVLMNWLRSNNLVLLLLLLPESQLNQGKECRMYS